MRTEAVLRYFNTDEQNWRSVPELRETESIEYVGRPVAALAADPNMMAKDGHLLRADNLAREYGFTWVVMCVVNGGTLE
jgi:hypothetical protein